MIRIMMNLILLKKCAENSGFNKFLKIINFYKIIF